MSVLRSTSDLRAALRSFDAQLLSVADAARVAEELTATAKACTAAGALAAARAAECGANDAASWFARQSGITPGQARQALDTARSMAELPDTKDALLSGDISMAQAAEIAQAEHDHPGAERELLPETRKSDLARTKQNTRDYKQAHTPVEELHAEQMAARHFRHWRDRLGMVCFEGSLPPQAGLPFMARLEQAALTLRRASRAAAEPRQAFPQYLADALAQLTGPEAKVSARTELIIVCDLDAWRRGFALPGENCHIIGGGPIPVELARELAKDAFLKAVLYKGVAIHTVAHFGRHYPAHLQTALDIGAPPDFQGRICTGCGRRYALQTDHIDPVAHHGPTKYDNLQSLCWDCHARKTEEDRKAGLLGPHARARPPNPSR